MTKEPDKPSIPNITTEELAALEQTKGPNEWNAVCDRIKSVRGGEYPPDWFAQVHVSGFGRRVSKKWPSNV